jgi:hypothetical protein
MAPFGGGYWWLRDDWMKKHKAFAQLTLKEAVALIVSRTGDDETVVRSRISYHRKLVKKSNLLKMSSSGKFELPHLVAWASDQKGWAGCFSGLPTTVSSTFAIRWSIEGVAPQNKVPISYPDNPVANDLLKEIQVLQGRIDELEAEVAELKPDALAKRAHRANSGRRPSKNK